MQNKIDQVPTVCGVGVNDLDNVGDRAYSIWATLLERAYVNPPPTYVGCSVHEDWHLYSNFKAWFEVNSIEGYHLDKDLLIPGNKVYGPDTCAFVPSYINTVPVYKNKLSMTGYPGVRANVVGNTYHAQNMHKGVMTNGKAKRLALDAHCSWMRMKADSTEDYIQDYMKELTPDHRVVEALTKYISLLRRNARNRIATFCYGH